MRTIPWLTPQSIDFLKSFLAVHPAAMVLEFGSGGSTIWFAEHGVTAISIEHDAEWFDKVKAELKARGKTANLRLLPRPYDSVCKEFPDEFFDLVLVDGRDRVRCIEAAHSKVKPGGVLMLDNSDRSEYAPAFVHLSGWQSRRTHTDGEGEGGWDTSWWIKPGKAHQGKDMPVRKEDGVFAIGFPSWTNEELRAAVAEFAPVFANRPIKDNFGGMDFIELMFSWFMLRKLKPKVVLEVGVFKGQGTWLIEQALPDAIVHSIDINLEQREYISNRVAYHGKDPTLVDWSTLPKNETLAFFDDHQDAIVRIRFCEREGFRYVAFSDNYAVGIGDCQSPKKGFEDDETRCYLSSVFLFYYEFPPILKTPVWRRGIAWDFPTPDALFANEAGLPPDAVEDSVQRVGYTSFCIAEMKPR